VTLVALAVVAAGCRQYPPTEAKVNKKDTFSDKQAVTPFDVGGLTGNVTADGSESVGGLVKLAAGRFKKANPDVRIVVGTAGDAVGFARLCAGKTDLADASGPMNACPEKRAQFLELQAANDGDRPLFIYASRDAVENKLQVDEFLAFILDHQEALARQASLDPLTAEQLDKSQTILDGAAIQAGVGEG
jgi:hypothetical protein